MLLAKVLSRVVSTAKLESVPEAQLLEIEPLPGFGERTAKGKAIPFIAIDTVGAGPGDLVLVLQEGTGARQCVSPEAPDRPLPAQVVIVGIVDHVESEQGG
jgi:ethanolamine utilization protein EutN